MPETIAAAIETYHGTGLGSVDLPEAGSATGIDRAADYLTHGGINVTGTASLSAAARIAFIGQPLADHRRDALEER